MVLKQLDDNTAVCFCVKRHSFSCVKHIILSNREIRFGGYCHSIKTTTTTTTTAITNPSRIVSLEE